MTALTVITTRTMLDTESPCNTAFDDVRRLLIDLDPLRQLDLLKAVIEYGLACEKRGIASMAESLRDPEWERSLT